jgi:hypothetical protein
MFVAAEGVDGHVIAQKGRCGEKRMRKFAFTSFPKKQVEKKKCSGSTGGAHETNQTLDASRVTIPPVRAGVCKIRPGG